MCCIVYSDEPQVDPWNTANLQLALDRIGRSYHCVQLEHVVNGCTVLSSAPLCDVDAKLRTSMINQPFNASTAIAVTCHFDSCEQPVWFESSWKTSSCCSSCISVISHFEPHGSDIPKAPKSNSLLTYKNGSVKQFHHFVPTRSTWAPVTPLICFCLTRTKAQGSNAQDVHP